MPSHGPWTHLLGPQGTAFTCGPGRGSGGGRCPLTCHILLFVPIRPFSSPYDLLHACLLSPHLHWGASSVPQRKRHFLLYSMLRQVPCPKQELDKYLLNLSGF